VSVRIKKLKEEENVEGRELIKKAMWVRGEGVVTLKFCHNLGRGFKIPS
jgi:hypothetical protein